MGWDLLLAEYRGYGGSTGEPLLGRMLDDVEAVLRAAGPPERLVVFGRSVGSLFALEAVARCPGVAGLVLESAIADPLERLLLRVTPRELGVTPPPSRRPWRRGSTTGPSSPATAGRCWSCTPATTAWWT